MTEDRPPLAGRPDILLMLQEGLPDDIEVEARTLLERPGLTLMVIRQPGGPYAGAELYLPSAIALFVTAGFFNGLLQEVSKDAYGALKATSIALWKRAAGLNVTRIGSAGKVSASSRYSLAYSITGEVVPGLSFKFVVQTDVRTHNVEVGIATFVDLIDDLLNDRVGEEDVKALLTSKPVGGTVLVTFDAESRKIIPVNAFEERR